MHLKRERGAGERRKRVRDKGEERDGKGGLKV